MEKAQMSRMNRRTYISPENTHTHIPGSPTRMQTIGVRVRGTCESRIPTAAKAYTAVLGKKRDGGGLVEGQLCLFVVSPS